MTVLEDLADRPAAKLVTDKMIDAGWDVFESYYPDSAYGGVTDREMVKAIFVAMYTCRLNLDRQRPKDVELRDPMHPNDF